jgi:hypothetical protein
MITKSLKTLACAALAALASAPAFAATATFTGTTTGCPNCASVDVTTGLTAAALGHQLPNGWDVKTGSSGLYLANRTGGVFTLPNATFPGKTFDLTGLKLFAYGAVGATLPITLYAYHFGNPIADTIQVNVSSRAVQTLTLADPRLQGVDTLVLRYDPLQISYVYLIQMTFTPR